MSEKYEGKVTADQKKVLLEFMENHPDFAKGKLLGVDGRKTRNSMWEVLSTQLNSCEGPRKTALKWQRVWIDLKNKIKKKAAEIKRSRLQTGGGPPSLIKLTDFEEQIIAFLTEEAVYGLSGPDEVPLDSEESFAETRPVSSIDVDPVPSTSRGSHPSIAIIEEMVYMDDIQDHDYILSPTSSSLPSPVTHTPPEDIQIDTSPEASAKGKKTTKRKVGRTPAEEAMYKFEAIGEKLNDRMSTVIDKLDDLVKEKKRSNDIMQQILEVMKNKK